jgi:hypothetical protein
MTVQSLYRLSILRKLKTSEANSRAAHATHNFYKPYCSPTFRKGTLNCFRTIMV